MRQKGGFKTGEVLDVRLPTQDFKIELVKQVSFKAAGQTYDSFYMESKPPQYKLWFDAGSKKLPLRISGSMGVANTTMTMTDYKE
jgi:hypothetical protein